MTRMLGTIMVFAYIVLCFIMLALWLPNFFASNFDYTPEASYRYLAATGLPFGLLLVTVIARQSLKGFFSITMFFQVVVAGALLFAAISSFYYTRQSNFFCAMHLILCALSIVWNLYYHRKELERIAALKPTGNTAGGNQAATA